MIEKVLSVEYCIPCRGT